MTSLNEVLDGLPDLEPLDDACRSGYAPGTGPDLLVFVSGFEPRATAVAAALIELDVTAPDACYLTYRSNESDNEQRRPELVARMSPLANHIGGIEAESDEPQFVKDVVAALEHAAPDDEDAPLRILFDVSGASGRMILRVLRTFFDALDRLGRDIELTVAYAQAESYFPTQEEAENVIAALQAEKDAAPGERQRTLGLDYDAAGHIYNINYPGQHLDTLTDRAVIVCGFNHDRLRATLDHIDPNLNIEHPHAQATFFVGRPPREEDAWRHDAMIGINALDAADGAVDLHSVSTLNYKELLVGLEQVYQRSLEKGERITLVPFGSKLQTIAAALFTEMRRDVRVVLALPLRYKGPAYSEGVRELRALRFGSLAAVREQLEQVGLLSIVDGPLEPTDAA